MFILESSFEPAWDQPNAIRRIVDAFNSGESQVCLLWATGTWKTFTMAHVIKELGIPVIILSHNKTLAAQLATEFKHFFPKHPVHYFVSYFDYYQPESYLPEKWVFIEKEATINKEIEMYRLATMASLLDKNDSIVVSSVSAMYWVGDREYFKANRLPLKVGKSYNFDDIKAQLLAMQYKPVQSKIEQWMFDIQGETIDIYSSVEQILYRLHFSFNELSYIHKKDALTFEPLGQIEDLTIRPATQYIQDLSNLEEILEKITEELAQRIKYFQDNGQLVEAQRLKKRVEYDMRMIKETGFVNGIENYWPYFEKRLDWSQPNTLFDYFPDDCLIIIDESHMTIPQFGGMPRADATRKSVLVEHWFRLPSAIHHRPISFEEMTNMLSWKESTLDQRIRNHHNKPWAKTLYVSATPWDYEIKNSSSIIQQVIRPTGLLDPITYVYPKSWEYINLMTSIDDLLPVLSDLLNKDFEKTSIIHWL